MRVSLDEISALCEIRNRLLSLGLCDGRVKFGRVISLVVPDSGLSILVQDVWTRAVGDGGVVEKVLSQAFATEHLECFQK